MTDEEYVTLAILIETKQLTETELLYLTRAIHEEDPEIIINWLWHLPDIPPKPRRRMTTADYRSSS